MKKILTFFLVALLLVSSVFAASLERKQIEKAENLVSSDNFYDGNFKRSSESDTSKEIEVTSEKVSESKLKSIIQDIKDSTRDFEIFSDPVIFQEFVQFNDYVTMFETYMEYLYVDDFYAEEGSVEELNVDELDVSDWAYIEDLEVENLEVEELDVDEFIYSPEIATNELWVDDEARFDYLEQDDDNEIAFACIDEDGILFRSDIPCNELNGNSNMELYFYNVGEVLQITYQNQDFEIYLTEVNEEEEFAVFIVNGDYELIHEGDEENIGGLYLELDELDFDDEILEELILVVRGLAPIGPVMEVEEFPISHQFNNLYENFMFDPPGYNIPVQDIEVIQYYEASDLLIIQINDAPTLTNVEEGVIYIDQGITFEFTYFNYNNGDLIADIVVYDVDEEPAPEPLYPNHFMTDGIFNGNIVVGSTAPTQDVIIAIDLMADLNDYGVVSNDSMVLDTQINNLEDQNLIAIGTACSNSVIYELLENPEPCDQYEQEGIGILYAEEVDDEIYTLVVDGYGYAERKAAADVLVNWDQYEEDFDLRNGAICIQLPINEITDSANSDNYVVSYC